MATPDEIQVKLSDLQGAAEQFRTSYLRIDESMQAIRLIVDSLYAAGYDGGTGTFAVLYVQNQASIQNWLNDLNMFAGKLSGAAHDVERAITPHFTRLDALYRMSGQERTDLGAIATAVAPIVQPIPTGTSLTAPSDSENIYLNAANRPLLNQLRLNQMVRDNVQGEVNSLQAQRDRLQADLTALKNRLLSYNPHTNVNTESRVLGMQEQIRQMDAQIASAQERVNILSTSVNNLTTRLNRVLPGAGADVALIQHLENSSTDSWVKANTKDCVQYIVNRIAIPGQMASNAHLWDERVAVLPQYGITTGDVPLVGSVLVMEQTHSYANPVFGHLMYVEQVDVEGVWITDNTHNQAVLLSTLTSETTGANLHYLYFPWHTHA